MSSILMTLTLIFNIVVAVFGIARKEYTAPYTVFSVMWSVIISIYLFIDNGWYQITTESSVVFFIGNFILLSMMLLVGNSKSKQNICVYNEKGIKHIETYELNIRLTIVLSIITILLFAYDIPEKIVLLSSGMSFNDIDRLINLKGSYENFYLKMLRVILGRPFAYCSACILINEILRVEKKHKLIIVLQLVIQAEMLIQNGKRSMIIFMVLLLIFETLSKNGYERLNIKLLIKRMALGALVIASIILLIWISNRRDSNVVGSVSIYFSGGIPSFDVRHVSIKEHYYGMGLLNGLLVPIMLMLHGVFHIPYPIWYLSLQQLVEATDYVRIGANSVINAFNTLYYIPYLDGGIFAVVIEMIIVGIIYGVVYRNFKKNSTYRNNMLNGLLLIGIFGSMYTLYFTQYPYALSFFYVLFLTRKKNVIEKE